MKAKKVLKKRALVTSITLAAINTQCAEILAALTEVNGRLVSLGVAFEKQRDINQQLLAHCRRLLAEKETLVKMIGEREIQRRLAATNQFMAEPR